MGKGARARQQRAAREAAGVSMHGLARLRRLTNLVGDYWEGQAQCIEGVALLCRTAALDGYQLQPCAVAVAVQGSTGSAALGARAGEAFGWDFPPGLNGWDTAGHLIATLDRPAHVFDPTLSQVSPKTGLPELVIAEPVDTLTPVSGTFDFTVAGCGIRYYLEPEDQTWGTRYTEQYEACALVAQDLLDALNAGPNAQIYKEPRA